MGAELRAPVVPMDIGLGPVLVGAAAVTAAGVPVILGAKGERVTL
jgi:hypothetical protein